MRCTLVTDGVVESIITIKQEKLDCQSYLTSKTSNSVILPLSYVHGRAKASYGISYFFTIAPKVGCDNTETCALNCALQTRTLIKSNWVCGDSGTLESGPEFTGLTLDECETKCQEEPLCVWFVSNGNKCFRRKEGC